MYVKIGAEVLLLVSNDLLEKGKIEVEQHHGCPCPVWTVLGSNAWLGSPATAQATLKLKLRNIILLQWLS